PQSFVRAGELGLPLMIAIIGGEPRRFRPLVDLYREAGSRSGHSPDRLKVGVHALGYVAATTREAADEFFPGYARAINDVGQDSRMASHHPRCLRRSARSTRRAADWRSRRSGREARPT